MNKSIVMFVLLTFFLFQGQFLKAQQALGLGNIVVSQRSNSASTATTFSLLEFTPNAANQTPVQSIPVTGLWTSGTASSVQYLRSNPNGSITFTGHTSTGSGNVNTVLGRGVGVLNPNGSVTLGPTYTGISGNQTRSAVTSNGIDFYIGDQSGIYLNSGTSPALAANIRGMQIVNGQTYVFQQSGTVTNIQVSTTNPALPAPTGSVSITGLPGMTNSSTLNDVYLLSTTSGAPNLMYVSNTNGITKFAFDGTSWIARDTFLITGGAFGIAAQMNADGDFDIYYTTGSGATGANF